MNKFVSIIESINFIILSSKIGSYIMVKKKLRIILHYFTYALKN